MRTHYTIMFIIFLYILSCISHVSSYGGSIGGSTLEPFDEDRYYLHGNIGDHASLSFNASLSPVTCVLYLLEDAEQSDNIYSLDLNSLSHIYNRTALEDESKFTVNHEWGFLLVVWNPINITQQFSYEWFLVNAEEEMQQLLAQYTLPLIPILVCVIGLFLFRQRHRQLKVKEMQQ